MSNGSSHFIKQCMQAHLEHSNDYLSTSSLRIKAKHEKSKGSKENQ